MASPPKIKPTHKAIKDYYVELGAYSKQKVKHEGALRSAFQNLLSDCGRLVKWTLIPELPDAVGGKNIRPDGTFRDEFYIERGYWEAKDTQDKLDVEIRKKIAKGYRLTNTIFEDTRRALLYQNGQLALTIALTDPKQLCDLLNTYFSHVEPAHENFEKAIEEFGERVPDLAKGLVAKIQAAHKNNSPFKKAFNTFYDLCSKSLNPNLSAAAVDEMLVQHLLTERLIRTIFSNPNFTRRNVIAAEVENVVDALVSSAFNREDFLKSLDRFYLAIESAAQTIQSFADKQHFLNVIYERFFQGYSVKVADTHGIVYTPQPIVDFMCASVSDILQHEFGRSLGHEGVNVLDPCTGTGNFIANILRRIPHSALSRIYHHQLFANEVMLMPYYIASLNLEHAYYELHGEYEPFEGLCFVDTLDLAESDQHAFGFMTAVNTQRVERQKTTPITVIIGNPPYNIGQLSENDNNKNRAYRAVDKRIQQTYGSQSRATLTNKLYDPYVKFFRWATDRLENRDGIVCYISNNSFVDQVAFDGMRACLGADFSRLYHLDLMGNVRHDPDLSGTAYNVFGIQVGVGITIAVKNKKHTEREIHYHSVPREWRREEKLRWLAETQSYAGVKWKRIVPDNKSNWLRLTGADDFSTFVPIGSREAKGAATEAKQETIFKTYSLGVSTNRDSVTYEFQSKTLTEQAKGFAEDYNAEVDRWKRHRQDVKQLDDFIDVSKVKWSSTLKQYLLREEYAKYDKGKIRVSLYRPFSKQYVYYDHLFVDRPGLFSHFLPDGKSEKENKAICVPAVGNRGSWACLAVNVMPNLNLTSIDAFQCFPFYLYEKDGTGREENITNWVLKLCRERYGKSKITKWDIFYYVYGVLFHPGYRERFERNLRRELPRIPLCEGADRFVAFRDAGEALAKLHIDYESVKPWPLKRLEQSDRRPDYRVEKMRLSGDRKSLRVNDWLTLTEIPSEAFDYRVGSRSALEWIIGQYQVARDKEEEIIGDPNRGDDPEYIVRLVGQVVRVSVETAKIVKSLPVRFDATR